MTKINKIQISPKEELLSSLHYPENALFLYKENRKTGEKILCTDYCELSELPDIREVIHHYGFETHDFKECCKIMGDIFENDDDYLPFDNDEIYITSEDRYEGCCTVGGFEFTTKDWHFYFDVHDIII